MQMKTFENVTMSYNYGNHDVEYVFSYKNRPFSVLVSSNIPTPTSSYIDHKLATELGLKMSDLQCKKISFCGKKLRMLGKVTCTVQCIRNGRSHGNFFMKAAVIENLTDHFDTHCVAGVKMKALLRGEDVCDSAADSDEARTPSKSSEPTSSSSTPASIPSDCSTPTKVLLQKVAAGLQSPMESPETILQHFPIKAPDVKTRSPPGFPVRPQFSPQPTAAVSPLSSNIRRLGDMFGDADTQPHDHAQLRALKDADPGGAVTYDHKGVTTFYSTEGYNYALGHGRQRCAHNRCYNDSDEMAPHNCGFSCHWTLPRMFQFCGPNCRGGFCSCLRLYR